MAHDTVRGVVIIARAGDRVGYEQNPMNYDSSPTECTPLGEVRFYFASLLPSVTSTSFTRMFILVILFHL